MKLIGLEFRIGMDRRRILEVATYPLDIVFPYVQPYPYGPIANVTLHTSVGDATASFDLDKLLLFDPALQRITLKEIDAAYAKLKAQVERIRV